LGGRVTEINEMDYLRKIEGFMKKKLTPSKVPGPWSDDGFNENFALEMKKLKLLQEEQKILKKQENKEEKQNKSKNDPATLLSRNPQTKKTEVRNVESNTEVNNERIILFVCLFVCLAFIHFCLVLFQLERHLFQLIRKLKRKKKNTWNTS
jgi:superfamily II DNA/RNA helicase